MNHPFYLLHVTDFHLIKEDQEISQRLKLLKHQVKLFLENKQITNLDFVFLTGDFQDKNGKGSENNNHEFAIDTMNGFLEGLIYEKTKIFCCPGNHDLNILASEAIIGEQERIKYYTDPKLANYDLVDKNFESLSETFESYIEFAKGVNASNYQNKDLDYLQGCQVLSSANFEMHISWFNTSWLSLDNPTWRKYSKNYYEAKKRVFQFRDEEFISPGKEVIQEILNSIDEFNSVEDDKYRFSLSFMHHYIRYLNWYDIVTTSKMKEDYPRVEKSFYDTIRDQDLVLSGHTHIELYDPPDSGVSGLATRQSDLIEDEIVIFEIDVLHESISKFRLRSDGEVKHEVSFFGDSSSWKNLKKGYNKSYIEKRYILNDFVASNYLNIDYGEYDVSNYIKED